DTGIRDWAETGGKTAAIANEDPNENAGISLTGLTNGNAVEGQTVTATVTEADAPASGITFTWTVDGVVVKTGVDAAGSSYKPTEAGEGKAISVADPESGGSGERGTGGERRSNRSDGTVDGDWNEDVCISVTGLTNGNAVEGQTVTATVTEADAPASGITFTWTVDGVVVKTGVDAAGSSYKPTEADEGKAISVAVSFTGTHGLARPASKRDPTPQDG